MTPSNEHASSHGLKQPEEIQQKKLALGDIIDNNKGEHAAMYAQTLEKEVDNVCKNLMVDSGWWWMVATGSRISMSGPFCHQMIL